jgi:hypothetical protein
MFTFHGIAIHDKLGQQFVVDGEWQDSATGWVGGLIAQPGLPPLPVGSYTVRTNTGDELQIRITSMITRAASAKRCQPFVGIGPAPESEDETDR